ncbi:MAG: cupin domain-containing protein [Candidatus Thermoplasmatota archaeon]|nr:cupin domain-containing protein [Candidatus Thermoplasmatota archaeon]
MAGDKRKLKGLGSVESTEPVEVREGIARRTLVYGERVLVAHWEIHAGTRFGEHSHIYEQAGFVLKGRLRMIIDGEPTELTAGSAYLVPSDVKHDAIALEDVEVVDTFTPVREEYID